MVGYRLFYEIFREIWKYMCPMQKIIWSGSWEYSRLGVPLFMMITGALILNKKFETKEDIITFYKKNIFPLFVCNEIWVLIYWGINIFTEKCNIEYVYLGVSEDISLLSIFRQLLLFQRGGYPNLWYLPAIIGIYFFLPFVSVWLNNYSSIAKWIVLVAVIVLFLFTDLNNWMKMFGIKFRFESALTLGLGSGGTYFVYSIVGYWLYRGKVERVPCRIWWLLGGMYFSCYSGNGMFLELGG